MGKTLKVIVAALTGALILRGLDYLWPPFLLHPYRPFLDPASYLDPVVWGIVCLLGAAIILTGVMLGNRRLVSYGCFVAGAINLMLGVPMVGGLLDASRLDDFRYLGDHAARVVIWWTLAACILRREVIRQHREGVADDSSRSGCSLE